jgi:hypothetical protein
MHRSGTSLIARLIYNAGGDFGNPETFYRPDKWNSEGYYEQPEIFKINRKLLHGFWGRISYFFLSEEQNILKRGKKQSKQIQYLSAKYKGKFIKDPRFCLTLPAWIENGAQVGKIVVVVREPIQVAYSLKKRNHISVKLGLKLWFEHNSRLLNYIKDIPHVFLFYNYLLDSEKSFVEVKRMLDFLDIRKTEKEIADIIKKTIKTSMNHNRVEKNDYSPQIKEILNFINKQG